MASHADLEPSSRVLTPPVRTCRAEGCMHAMCGVDMEHFFSRPNAGPGTVGRSQAPAGSFPVGRFVARPIETYFLPSSGSYFVRLLRDPRHHTSASPLCSEFRVPRPDWAERHDELLSVSGISGVTALLQPSDEAQVGMVPLFLCHAWVGGASCRRFLSGSMFDVLWHRA